MNKTFYYCQAQVRVLSPKSKSEIQVPNPSPKSKFQIQSHKSREKGLGLGLTLYSYRPRGQFFHQYLQRPAGCFFCLLMQICIVFLHFYATVFCIILQNLDLTKMISISFESRVLTKSQIYWLKCTKITKD